MEVKYHIFSCDITKIKLRKPIGSLETDLYPLTMSMLCCDDQEVLHENFFMPASVLSAFFINHVIYLQKQLFIEL